MKAISEGCRCPAGRETTLSRKEIDQLLISLTFLVFLTDSPELRQAIAETERGTFRTISRFKRRFVDEIPLREYLTNLEYQSQRHQEALREVIGLFRSLVQNAKCGDPPLSEQQTAILGNCIELLIEQAARRLEKPDRLFSYAETLTLISQDAEILMGTEAERFFDRFKWAYPRGESFGNLNLFWTTCMVGLFLLQQVLGEEISPTQGLDPTRPED